VGRSSVRYSGSPLPLSLAEIDYPHQVCLVELEGEALASVEAIRVPRSVEMIRIPKNGALGKQEALEALRALPDAEGRDPERRPFLELRVALDRPDPTLRHEVETALEGKHARLVRLAVELGGDGKTLADRVAKRMLDELGPKVVFENRWKKSYEGEPPPELLEAFLSLVHEIEEEAR
jgi:exonuclease SbcD